MTYSTYEKNPANLIAFSFLSVILAGTALLKLPHAAAGQPLSWIDALFMATSATCVTGLAVVDPGTQLTFFGQVVLLSLVQLGGLGIMTYSVFFLLFFRVKATVTTKLTVPGLSRENDFQALFHALIFVLGMTLFFETIGAVLLFSRFRGMMPLPDAFFSSVFHAVSAFCNAGFSLFPDSLVRFQSEIFVPSVIMALIVLGGIGFVVVDEVLDWIRSLLRPPRIRLSLHTRVCLVGTAFLLVFGVVCVYLLERGNTLARMPLVNQVVNASFLSVTSRTAGFNTVDTSLLTNASLFVVILLMFIGGCPGSVAGGIKVTTFIVLAALIRSQVKAYASTPLFHRQLPSAIIGKALAIFSAGFIVVNLMTFFLQMTEELGVPHPFAKYDFLDLLFESVSAFGTVGLSTGVTPNLSPAGKALVSLTMFAGRIGPLTLGLAILMRRRRRARYEYAEEDVLVG